MKNTFTRLIAAVLCAALMLALPCAAFADESDGSVDPVDPVEPAEPAEPTEPAEPSAEPGLDWSGYYALPPESEGIVSAETVEDGVLDPDELKTLIEAYLDEHKLRHDLVRIGYTYTGTGESWFYNGDVWSYSASVYKLPLMMLFAKRVADGELTQDSMIYDIKLSYAETSILTYSNNDFAHAMMTTFPSEVECRKQWVALSGMPEEDFTDEFYVQSHFSPRFVVGVLKTLYENPEDYPNIIECLKVASPGEYLSRTLGDKYEIAQKYGAYEQFYNIAGIVYMPHPILVSINTEWIGYAEATIGEIGEVLADYTLTLDERLAEREREQAEEQRRLEEAAAEKPEESLPPETPAPTPENDTAPAEGGMTPGSTALLAAAVLVIILAVIFAVKLHREERRHRHHGSHSGHKK